ncbi:MAG: TspO/MBR family protein [Pseudomonadota bacterium]
MDIVVFLAVCLVAASSGMIFRPGEDYERLRFPSWRPPNYLFGLVWAVLYIMIAVSGWLVFSGYGANGGANDGAITLALSVYAVQLVLNFLWSAIFFGLKKRGVALFEMALLWLSILVMIVLFLPINALAAWLLVPYLMWVSFAFALNFSLWRLNLGAGVPNQA